MVKRLPERGFQVRGPAPPILMGRQVRGARSRTELGLTCLLRGIAVLWMVEGAHQWIGVLTGPTVAYLPTIPPLHITGLFFFCILDFVAAIGLWLLASWGVAIWIATILGHILAIALAPGFLVDPWLLAAADVILVPAYGALAWIVARERHAR